MVDHRWVVLSLCMVWLLLGVGSCRPAGPAPRAAAAPASAPATTTTAPTTRYAAMTVNGNKIGYTKTTRSVDGGTVTTVLQYEENARRGSAVLTRRVVETAVETAAGEPLSLRSVETTAGRPKRTLECVIRDGKAHLKAVIGETTRTAAVDWTPGPLLPEGERLLRKRKGFAAGTTYTYRKLTGNPTRAPVVTVTVGRTGPVELIGRTAALTELKVRNRDAFGNVTDSTGYVDADGNELKFVMMRVGMTMATITCSRAHALGHNRLADVLKHPLPKCPAPLKGIAKARSATFTLTPTGGRKLVIPALAGQVVRTDAEGNVVVVVRRADMPRGATRPYKGADAAVRAAMQPTEYLQSKDKTVAALARAAVGTTKDAAVAARKIERFVRGYVINTDSVDYAPAAEVARNRRGDCTEYAVLTAAMLRSVGVPAQVVVGVVYAPRAWTQTDVLVPHAWVRAYVGDRWVGLDAALAGFDPGHIGLSAGDGAPESLAAVYATVGFFKVKAAKVNP